MFDLKNKKVTIIGAARSGLAAADLVLKLGGIAKLSDSQANLVVPEGIFVEKGGHTKEFIQESDYIVLSPGVSIYSEVVGWAREKNIEVMGEVEFSSRFCPCPIVAITGSNGKTTTTTLIARILEKAGHHVCLCGNIGSPLSGFVLGLKKSDIVVMEISSFQLESIINFKPHLALWLNFSQNHLDRHKDLNEYFQAKALIFKNQDANDFAVLNETQREFKELARSLKAKVLFFNKPGQYQGITNPNYIAALTATNALGVSEELGRQVLQEFKGVEHRLELVRTLHGVDYINDSKSTTAEAGRWALERLEKPGIMICGGSDKHIDYVGLKNLVGQKVKHMIAIGQISGQLKDTFKDVVTLEVSDSLAKAVELAQKKAQPGDCVILSPMTASFDMFKDYEHRGRTFKELVAQLT